MPRTPRVVRSQFPQHLIDWYWGRVEDLLVNSHGVSRADAVVGIQRYRRAFDRVGAGDIIYNSGEDRTAAGIVTGGHLP